MEASVASPTAAQVTPTGSRPDATSAFDDWLLQKLRLEWSSSEFGGLLTSSKLQEALSSFPQLETPIKVRLLLSLLSVRKDQVEAASGQKEIEALLKLAEKDAEEWVKVSGGIVKQFLVLQEDGKAGDSYLHTQLEATAAKVVKAIEEPPQKRRNNSAQVALDDFFSLENGLLNAALRPQLVPTAATHFTVSGADDEVSGKEEVGERGSPLKKPLHRPQMARPLARAAASGAMASSLSSTTPASTTASTRLTPATVKAPMGKKKSLTDLSSEIRRKADAGRFKRQRNRISMIDLDEVKQIEVEKAQKAEERKKQKLAAKEKEKEKEREKEKEKEKNAAAAIVSSSETIVASEGDTVAASADDEHASIAADIFAMHQQPGPDDTTQQFTQQQQPEEETTTQASGEDYIPDGTQALLNAAFHSTQDIMKEVVSQQNQQQLQQQLQPPVFQQMYRPQQQLQMHPLAPPAPQFHQGFEPEDATMSSNNTNAVPMTYGGYNYGATPGYYGDQFGNYGTQDTNVYGSNGYAVVQPDNNVGLPPLGGRQLGFDPLPQQQQQQQQQQNNGGYMDGSGEYWR
ncbi:hypothetical protein PHYBOEH_005978 [Phytophthora boehmeriae]|uniref:NELF-A N-terminal domain-containing protein n=1 Tax=Phytophthora boehmeriae TaxID=109152 RepID=A0A8T1XAD8_9STRA|nr:hypothetical protein PHYBOEH_005978 [Phytophthora boehmeriae]